MGISDEILAKTNLQDSVFTNLFKIPEYTLQLYQALHPEDKRTTVEKIRIVTLENVLLNQSYNDLGFEVWSEEEKEEKEIEAKPKLVILAEGQSTWSPNVLPRILIYYAQTLQEYIIETKQNVYSSKKIEFPEPEFYVLYTGERKARPDMLEFTQEYFKGKETAINIKVKMLYGGKPGDILDQYVKFIQVYREQYKRYGRTQKMVLETIRLCMDRNVLKEYLESRRREVIDIMMMLFNKEYIMEAYTEEIRQESRKEGRIEGRKEGRMEGRKEGQMEGRKEGRMEGRMEEKKKTAANLARKGMEVDVIADVVEVGVDTVKQWLESGITIV